MVFETTKNFDLNLGKLSIISATNSIKSKFLS
jgi:hypothetical protein